MSFSASGGPAQSGSSSNAGVALNVSTPFNFDNSGWNVNLKGTGDQSARGNDGANAGSGATAQSVKTNWLLYGAIGLGIWMIARNS